MTEQRKFTVALAGESLTFYNENRPASAAVLKAGLLLTEQDLTGLTQAAKTRNPESQNMTMYFKVEIRGILTRGAENFGLTVPELVRGLLTLAGRKIDTASPTPQSRGQ